MYKGRDMILVKMIGLAKEVGTVTSAMWYDDDYLTVDGTTEDGKKFSLNLSVKGEKKDA